MNITVDGYSFDFTDAIDAFVFDERDSSKPTFHGVPMKAVDLVVELQNAYLFVEIKDMYDTDLYDERQAINQADIQRTKAHFKWMKNYLKYKFRDSYLYRHAEDKVDKPIHYICLLSFDNALNTKFKKDLKIELPVEKASVRWKKELAKSCQVLNLVTWNRNYPAWPVAKI